MNDTVFSFWKTLNRKFAVRWSLRALLLLFIPLAILLSYISYVKRQREAAWEAWQRVEQGLVEVGYADGKDINKCVLFIPHHDLTDETLIAFIPYFNGYASPGMPGFVKIKLNGSKVSPEAIERFRKAVPGCDVEP